ncbi:MAG: T9SS type A sorting domain-containing protein [Bacteroidota bacterium]|nr:T9SS type A sorting domain-containing protein [Bacteroidota bacterium]
MKTVQTVLALSLFLFSAFTSRAQTCQDNKSHSCHKTGSQDLQALATNLRSDTVDILNYTINLNITDFTGKVIKGNTMVKFTPKVNGVNQLNLDLLELIIDSIEIGSSNLTYSYNDTLLRVNLPVTHNINDTSVVTVHYQGVPQGDASGWGGFDFDSGYAYNLGVGFAADPHVYGRVWFPCFDNFVERSTYEFNIVTNAGKVSYCNGLLASDVTDGSGNRTRKWIMSDPIPTYLASVAVASYTQVNQVYNGLLGPIPIVLAAVASDTTGVKSSFINLPVALSTYEGHFGPYMWDRVGFCMVPFSSGAMEHATNISYPKATATGTLAYQTLYAHELSHHWFGDLATCRTAEDMWLNEGWARYCEFLFSESLGGYSNYMNSVRINHEDNLHFNIVKEGNLTLSNIPHAYTYGDHVYNKGADVAHTMRGYMGDSLFFYSVKTYLSQYNYKDVSSIDFRDALTAASGMNMNDFFDNWVFNPGWTHFSIDSFQVVPSGPDFNVTVFVKQKLRSAPSYYTNVPLEVTFKAADWTENTQSFIMSGANNSFSFTVPFNPVFLAVNMGEKIADAVAPEYKKITATGSSNFANAKMTLNVLAVTDSAFVRITHNYAEPDNSSTCCPDYRVSPDHYWKVDGIFPASFRSKATISYDGRTTSFAGNLWLDHNLVTTFEDSLVLMYRPNTATQWSLYPYYTRNFTGSNNDKKGTVTIDSLQKGEYVFAMLDRPAGINTSDPKQSNLVVYPNPAKDMVVIDMSKLNNTEGRVVILNSEGKRVKEMNISNGTQKLEINTSAFDDGMYFISIQDKKGNLSKGKFVIAH